MKFMFSGLLLVTLASLLSANTETATLLQGKSASNLMRHELAMS
jgi:hypothetical protein